MSFIAKAGYKVSQVFDVRAVVEGIHAFYIVKVQKPLVEEFERLLATDGVNLNQYGEVLHYGIGEPDAALKAELNKKYGMYA